MEERDKRDVLKDVQEYIKNNKDSKDKEALMQAIEKAIQQNYILDCDVLEVLNYIGANIWGIYHKGYRDYKGKWHDDSYELELGIWERGSLCCGMIKDAIRLLKKKFTYMQSKKIGGSSVGVSDSDAPELGGGSSAKVGCSSVDSKEVGKQPQQLEKPQKKRGRAAKPFSDCIMIENKVALLDKLHQMLDNRKGKDVYLILNTLASEGVLLGYTYAQARNEFGDIGSDSLKTKYKDIKAFETGEIEGVKKIFSEFLK